MMAAFDICICCAGTFAIVNLFSSLADLWWLALLLVMSQLLTGYAIVLCILLSMPEAALGMTDDLANAIQGDFCNLNSGR